MNDGKIWGGAIEKYRLSLVQEMSESLQETALHIDLFQSLKTAYKDAQYHQEKHIKDMRLKENSLDIYKALSWITWFMSTLCKEGGEIITRIAARAGINALNSTLTEEDYCSSSLPYMTNELLEAYLINEINDLPDHGIALNGLFITFHSTSEILKLNHN